MKIAVFSDSHGSSRGMINAVRDYAPDKVIHLGDGNNDLNALEKAFPAMPICAVAGNCDTDSDELVCKVIELGPHKAFLTHGHRYAVRYGKLDVLLYAAECSGANIVMFGHTHKAVFDNIEGMLVLNPGSARDTWAKLEIADDGAVSCEICQI